MAAAWLVARAHLRRYWRSVIVITLLTAVPGVAVLAAVDGAWRTRTAVSRFLAATRFPDVFVVVPAGQDRRVDPAAMADLEALGGIAAMAPLAGLFMMPADLDLPPGRETRFLPYVGTDERFGRDVLVPRIVAGRRAQPGRVAEMVISEATAATLGVGVGDSVRFASLTSTQVQQVEVAGADPGPPAGPEVELEVVGIARTLGDLHAGESLDDFPILLTSAFYQRYRPAIASFEGVVLVALTPDTDPAAFLQEFQGAFGEEAFAAVGQAGGGSLEQAIDTESFALAAFATVVALAGLVAVGQALSRLLALTAADLSTLRALGLSPGGRLAVGLLAAVPSAVVAALLTVAGAVAVAPWFAIGVAGRAEPEGGVSADALVLATGAVLVVVVVLGLAAASTWRIMRWAEGATPARSPSVITRRLGRSGLPAPASIGVRMALEPGRGRTAVPVRPALVGGVLGVAGILAALVVGASLDRLLAVPDRYGWNWDVAVVAGTDGAAADALAGNLASRPDVAAAGLLSNGLVRVADQRVWGVGFDTASGGLGPTVLEGRAPRTSDEIALGSAILARLGRSIGETVPVGPDGAEHRIVGRVVMPRTVDNDEPAHGALVAGDLGRLHPQCGDGDPAPCRHVLLRFVPGTDRAGAVARLQEAGLLVATDLRPVDVDTLAQIRSIPIVLAGVLAAVGVIALGHALVTTIRRRRRDLAVLEVLGFVGRQVRSVVAWQATTVAVVAVVVGLPLGLAVGRWGWGVLARSLGMADDPLLPVVAVVLAVVLTAVVANLVAAAPARTATRIRPVTVLRSE